MKKMGGTVATHWNDLQPICRPIALIESGQTGHSSQIARQLTQNHESLHKDDGPQQAINYNVPKTLVNNMVLDTQIKEMMEESYLHLHFQLSIQRQTSIDTCTQMSWSSKQVQQQQRQVVLEERIKGRQRPCTTVELNSVFVQLRLQQTYNVSTEEDTISKKYISENPLRKTY